MTICVVYGCNSRSDRQKNARKLSFYRFPKVIDNKGSDIKILSEERLHLWISLLKRKDLNTGNVEKKRVCSKHFIEGRPSKDPQHPDYVPSLFSFNKKGIEEGRKRLQRYERSLRRMSLTKPLVAKTLSPNNGTLSKDPQHSNYLPSQFSLDRKSIDQRSRRRDSISEATSSDYEDMFECSCCKSVYSCKYYLQKHIKKEHPEQVVHRDKPFKCSKCDRAYEESKNLKKHERIKHGAAPSKRQARLICHICSHPYATLELLCSHISESHDIEIDREDLEFSDENNFLQWKNKEELSSNAAFVKHGKSKPTKSGELTNYYFCKRSGFFKKRGNKYLMKSQGSCKIGGFCTAHMKVKIKVGGEHLVQYIKTHFGHSEELEHLWLTKDQKDELALKIYNNVPFDQILNEVRSAPLTSINRIHLLSRKDLYNIKKEYGLDNKVKRVSKKVKSDPPTTNHQKNIMKKKCELEKRHRESLSLCEQSVITYQDTFIVPSNTDDDEMFVVQLKNSDCNCKLRCKDCCVCVHNFTCSCTDAKMGNMCKHIHLVCRINKVSEEIEENSSDEASASAEISASV